MRLWRANCLPSAGTTLYIVGEGKVRVVVANAADGEIVQELSGGSFFGEIAFLATCVHAFKVAGQDVQLQVPGIVAPRSAPLCTCLDR